MLRLQYSLATLFSFMLSASVVVGINVCTRKDMSVRRYAEFVTDAGGTCRKILTPNEKQYRCLIGWPRHVLQASGPWTSSPHQKMWGGLLPAFVIDVYSYGDLALDALAGIILAAGGTICGSLVFSLISRRSKILVFSNPLDSESSTRQLSFPGKKGAQLTPNEAPCE